MSPNKSRDIFEPGAVIVNPGDVSRIAHPNSNYQNFLALYTGLGLPEITKKLKDLQINTIDESVTTTLVKRYYLIAEDKRSEARLGKVHYGPVSEIWGV